MWEPYLKVIREKCSDALHVLDRFHIVAKMNKALDEVCAEESRRMRREGRLPVLRLLRRKAETIWRCFALLFSEHGCRIFPNANR
jgi:transposase